MKKRKLLFLALLLPLVASAQWVSDTNTNTAITTPNAWMSFFEHQASSDGTTYFNIYKPGASNNVCYLQILDSEGNKLFEEGETLVSDDPRPLVLVNQITFLDSDGNLLMSVADKRNDPDGSTDAFGYFIYKVSPTGEMLWGEDGIDLNKGTTSELKALMKIIELEDGSYVFAWQEDAGYTTDGTDLYGIKMMRLSHDGEHQWSNTVDINSSTADYMYPYLTNAGSNQFILTYTEGSALYLKAQKYDFDGSTVWAEPTKVFAAGFGSSSLVHLIVDVKPMPNGGMIAGWYDDRYYTDQNSVYIAYINGDGTHAFSEGSSGLKVAYSDALSGYNPEFIYSETDECIYVVWNEVNYASQTYERLAMQKISLIGELQWDIEGKEIEPYGEHTYGNLTIRDAGDGNFAVFYTETVSYYDVVPHVIKYNSDGKMVWDGGSHCFASTTSTKSSFAISELVNDEYWIAAWKEDRLMSDSSQESLYAQKIYTDNPNAGIATYNSSDTPSLMATTIGETAHFALQLERVGSVELTLYNLAGEQIATLYSGTMDAGEQRITYNTSHLAAGIYLAAMRGDYTNCVRIVVD